jgi:phosphoheptose isomerase
MSHLPQLHEAIAAATKTLQSLVDLDAQIGKAADLIDQCLRAGNKLLVCGNGRSAADASHFATELVYVLPTIERRFRRFVSQAIAEF